MPGLAADEFRARSASAIEGVRISAVPGLLHGQGANRAGERAALLLARQELPGSGDCPDIRYVVDEVVVHRVTGGPAVMAGQLDRLRGLSAHPRVRAGVLPFAAGAWAVPAGSFTVTGSGDADATPGYHQAAHGRLIGSRDQGPAGRYREHVARMRAMALPVPQARELLTAATPSHQMPAETASGTGPPPRPEPGARRRTGQDSCPR